MIETNLPPIEKLTESQKDRFLEKAHLALVDMPFDHSAAYDVLRYARAGYYQVNERLRG